MVPATITNMSLFDRLTDQGIARKDGMIIKCMEKYIDGFQVHNRLEPMCINTSHVLTLWSSTPKRLTGAASPGTYNFSCGEVQCVVAVLEYTYLNCKQCFPTKKPLGDPSAFVGLR